MIILRGDHLFVPSAHENDEKAAGDMFCLISYLFKDDLPPDPFLSGDATCDGDATVDDVVYLISYLFRNGPPEC